MPHPFPNLPLDQRGALERHAIDLPRLADNPWSDPREREVLVWRSPGPQDTPRIPLLILPGFAGTAEAALGRGMFDRTLTGQLDELAAAGAPPFLAVLPELMTSIGGCQFIDSPAIGAYQSAIVEDLIPAIERRFSTVGRWGVTGRSSGAYGAFQLALRAPEKVGAVAWHAGDCGFDLSYLGDIPAAIRGIQAAGGVERFLRELWTRRSIGGDGFAAMNLIAMSCAYSPEPGRAPLPARLPFDPETGAIDFEVFQSWRRFDPIVQAADPANAATLRRLDLLFLDAGNRDEYLLHLGARRLVSELTRQGVPHVYEEFDGGHRGTAWRYDHSLPRLLAALAAASASATAG